MVEKRSSRIDATDILIGIGLLAEREFVQYGLSQRQRQIAYRMFQGQSGKAIAKRLYITQSCVRYHISIIYTKTKSKNREQFLNTIWKGIHRSDTSWKNKDEMKRDVRDHHSRIGEWVR